jgi:hypothetical protein
MYCPIILANAGHAICGRDTAHYSPRGRDIEVSTHMYVHVVFTMMRIYRVYGIRIFTL